MLFSPPYHSLHSLPNRAVSSGTLPSKNREAHPDLMHNISPRDRTTNFPMKAMVQGAGEN